MRASRPHPPLADPPIEPPAADQTPQPPAPTESEDAPEENIYAVMKDHMRRQKEELDARNTAQRQQARTSGRPGPQGAHTPVPPPKPAFDKVTDLTDLEAVWLAARAHLAQAVRYLESVLGHCCRIEALNPETGETILLVPASQQNFTNEKARIKLEESLRAVTTPNIRLALKFIGDEPPASGADPSRGGPPTPSPTSQRVPAELVEAIKQQRVVQELMKKLDANVVNIEMLGTGDPE